MAYEPITSSEALPKVGPFPETQRLDIKIRVPATVDGKSDSGLEDLACDLAAFANASGGVIVVGAHEEPRNQLRAYVDMDAAEAQRVVDAYGRRARELCSPQPIVDARAIDRGGGRFAVAVNVDAYSAPPIGVRMRSQTNDRPRWWAFPVRRGTDNVPMRPEELATVMDPRARRLSLQLDRLFVGVEAGRAPAIWLAGLNGTGTEFSLVAVDADGGSLTVRLATSPSTEMVLPLDLVQAVWRDAHGASCVSIRGKFLVNQSRWTFLPSVG